MSNDREQRIVEFFNAIHPHRQIRFQNDAGLPRESEDGLAPLPAAVYVDGMHDDGVDNPRRALEKAIRRSQTADCFYWSGMRGAGKTTELLKLKQSLEARGDFIVFYADMSLVLQESEPVEVGDFLLLLLSELAGQVEARYGAGVLERAGIGAGLVAFLQQQVSLEEVAWEPSFFFGAKFKFKVKQNPDFKQKLQQRTRGQIDGLVEQAREFVRQVVVFLQNDRQTPPRLVYLVDSMERLRGIGSEKSAEVFRSVENLFGYHRDKLRFPDLTVVYSVPPYLSAVVSGAENNRVFSLTALKVFERPEPGKHGDDHATGIDKLVAVVSERFPGWREFFSEPALRDLAHCSGGDYREFFLLMRETLNLVDAEDVEADGIPARFVEHVKKLRRNEFEMSLASLDMDWLIRVVQTHDHGMLDREKDRPTLANYIDGKLIYRYRNGSYWWDIHPLLWASIDREIARRAG